MRLAALAAAAALASASTACTKMCTTEADAGIVVRLTDQATGAIITGADVEAVDGSYLERLMDVGGNGQYAGAYERAGTYTVTISASGYTPMTLEPVVVSAGDCHVTTRTFDVMLSAK